jgi:hypothetical protein
MAKIIEQQIGQFLIRAVAESEDDSENGISVFVKHGDQLVFCDNFDNNLFAAKQYIQGNSKGKIKIVNGEFYSKV